MVPYLEYSSNTEHPLQQSPSVIKEEATPNDEENGKIWFSIDFY